MGEPGAGGNVRRSARWPGPQCGGAGPGRGSRPIHSQRAPFLAGSRRSFFGHDPGAAPFITDWKIPKWGSWWSTSTEEFFADRGVDLTTTKGSKRPLVRSCLDWTERQPHVAGRLGAALLQHLLEQWRHNSPVRHRGRAAEVGRQRLLVRHVRHRFCRENTSVTPIRKQPTGCPHLKCKEVESRSARRAPRSRPSTTTESDRPRGLS